MVYTRRKPAVFIIGLLLLPLGWAASTGQLDGFLKTIGAEKMKGEMSYLPYVFGVLGVLIGLWQLTGPHKPGNFDYFTSAIGGGLFVLLVAMILRWFADPMVATLSKNAGPIFGGKYIHDVFGLNYVVLGILAVIWRPLFAATVNRELAEAEGLDPDRANLVYMVLMATVIALAMKIVGVLLITALLIVPAAYSACAGSKRTPPECLPRLIEVRNPDGRTLDLWWHRLVRLVVDANGLPQAKLIDGRGSGDSVAAGMSDGFVEMPPGSSGAILPYYAWPAGAR